MLVILSPAYYAQSFKKAGHRGIPSICPWQKRKTICLELRQLELVCQCYSSVSTSCDQIYPGYYFNENCQFVWSVFPSELSYCTTMYHKLDS